MIKSIYNATSGMIVQQKRQENVSNNLANAETPSFKVQTILTQANPSKEIYSKTGGENEEVNLLGFLPSGSEIDEINTDFKQGMITETSRDLDYAIDGNGFFNIEVEAGVRGYTRNGSFDVDAAGYLINSQGYAVIGKNLETGENEKISVEDGFSIQADGRVLNESGNNTYSLMMSDFLEYVDLNNLGNGVYLNQPQDGLNKEIVAEDLTLVQGTKEMSNVDVLQEMVKMIEISRAYESNQRVIQSLDEILSKVVNQVGKL